MRKQKGFGLLEILITLVLLGIGVAGLVALARNMLSAAQEGRRYEVAMRLAESKLDEFRNFNGVANAVSGATQLVYSNIVSGSLNNLTPSDAGGSYDLSWAVSNEYLASGAWSTINSAAAPYPDRKVIRVTVNWQDNTDTPRTLTLEGAISPTGSFIQKNLGSLLTPRTNPEVEYSPEQAPDVLAIELDGDLQETSKPLPQIKAGSSSRLVQFDTITYQNLNSATTRKAVQDIATVSCSCTFSGERELAYLPAEPIYIQSDKVQYWRSVKPEGKYIGELDGNANQQEKLCTSCCHDHYDLAGGGFSSYYAPLNKDRKRYKLSGSSSLVESSIGSYIDACRFTRIDGFYRPLPDWNLVKVVVAGADFFAKPKNALSYQNYIKYVAATYINWQVDKSNSLSIDDFPVWLQGNAVTDGDKTTLVTMNTGTAQLVARGIYIDLLSPSYLNSLDLSSLDLQNLEDQTKLLEKIPFQDINLTMLAEWNPGVLESGLSGTIDQYVEVTNENINTINDPSNYYFGTYSRGFLSAKKVTGDKSASILVKVYQGNSGVTASPISSVDMDEAKTASLPIIINATPNPSVTVTGTIKCQEKPAKNGTTPLCDRNIFSIQNLPALTTNIPGVSCTIFRPNASIQSTYYTCTTPPNVTLTVDFSYPDGSYLFNPDSLRIEMTPPSDGGNVFTGPCVLLVNKDVTNATNLKCAP